MPVAARRVDLANMRAHRRPRHARSSSHATGHDSPDHPGVRSLWRRRRQTTAIRFGKLWDGSTVTTDAVVVVDGDRITSVGTGNAAVPRGARVIDLRKYTGIPGLIDLHTHITYYWDRQPGTRPRGQRRLPAVTVYLAQDNARRTLETGVTTVRDLNAGNDMDLAMRELTASGAMIGPRIFASGPGLSAQQGQPPDPERMKQLVEDRVKAGVDWIKVFGSRGGFENVDGTQTVTFDEMKAVVDAAHALGKKVAIHSYGPSGVRDAVRAGADSIEHGADVDEADAEGNGRSAGRCGCRRSITTAITSMRQANTASRRARMSR